MIKQKRGMSGWIWILLVLIVVGIGIYFWLSGDGNSLVNSVSGGPPALPN